MTGPRIPRSLRCLALVPAAWLGLVMFDLVRLAGFRAIHAALRRTKASTSRSSASEAEILWSVDEACVWYWKRAACLQRSAASTWLLRRHGVAADMVIGFRPLPFESHAWVEVNGQVVNDRPQYQRAFQILDRV